MAKRLKVICMELSAVFQAIFETKTDGSAFAAADLQPGDRLTGRVLKVVNNGRALIDLGAFRATARMGFSVHPGQMLQLKVIHSGNTLHLQADLKSTPQSPRGLPQLNFTQLFTPADQQQLVGLLERMMRLPLSERTNFQVPEGLQQALVQVQAIFEDMPIQKPIARLVQWLRHTVEDRGIWFEKKLADAVTTNSQNPEGQKNAKTGTVRAVIVKDLKSNLLILKSFLSAGDTPELISERVSEKEMKWVRQGIQRMLDHICQQQDRVVRNWREGDSFQIITHVIPFKAEKQPVQLKVFYSQKGPQRSEDCHQRVTLLLHMDQLGPVRADVVMAGRHLKIQFFVQRDAVRQRFEQQSDDIVKALQGLFEDVVLIASVSEKKIAQFNLPEQSDAALGRIDILI